MAPLGRTTTGATRTKRKFSFPKPRIPKFLKRSKLAKSKLAKSKLPPNKPTTAQPPQSRAQTQRPIHTRSLESSVLSKE